MTKIIYYESEEKSILPLEVSAATSVPVGRLKSAEGI